MSVDVRIPTILRSYTGGAKAVEATGDTLAGVLDDLDTRHPGIRDRLVTEQRALHRFVNVYVNDEDVRFLGALEAKVSDGDTITILPAVAGGAGQASGASQALAGIRVTPGGAGQASGASQALAGIRVTPGGAGG
jgi:MoaD family protein